VASDGVQWKLRRHEERGSDWHAVSFVHSTRAMLARCIGSAVGFGSFAVRWMKGAHGCHGCYVGNCRNSLQVAVNAGRSTEDPQGPSGTPH
jgi:hypothetical protein